LNIGLLNSCKNKSSKNNRSRSQYNSYDGYNEEGYNEDVRDEYGHIEDGTYTATVDYKRLLKVNNSYSF
jgi:hypothetical protein